MDIIQTTGRRKTAVARVRLFLQGDGTLEINHLPLQDFFKTDPLRAKAIKPLILTEKLKTVSVKSSIHGGGISAQAEALSHGISRAIVASSPELRSVLKKAGLLTRDSRMKERKKYGQKGARKRFQYSKR